jgi:hypothetical protein
MTPPVPRAPAALDLRDLLSIDVAAELRKLSQAQLEGSWQVPAELVRRAIRAGARRVEVRFARRFGRQLVVSDDGAPLDPALADHTHALIDPRRGDQLRHHAFVALERAGELSLLALLGLAHLRRLDIRRSAAGGTEIAVHAGGVDRRRARRWLADVARFAPVALVVDGRALDASSSRSRAVLIEAPLEPPLAGRVALLAEGDTPQAFLLAHGLASAHVGVPGGPPFEAAVELGGAQDSTPAGLRDALTPLLPTLIDQAMALLLRLAPQLPRRPELHRARAARLLLQAVRGGMRSVELERLPVIRAITARGPALVDLGTLRRLVRPSAEGMPTLLALAPDQPPGDHAVGDDPIVVADEAERSLLAQVLAVGFQSPDRRASSFALAALVRRAAQEIRRSSVAGWERIRHPGRRPPLPAEALTEAERQLLSAFRTELGRRSGARLDVAMCEGEGPVRRRRAREPRPALLLLPRANQTVQASVRAFAADPSWLRVIQPALLAGVRSQEE